MDLAQDFCFYSYRADETPCDALSIPAWPAAIGILLASTLVLMFLGELLVERIYGVNLEDTCG